MVLRQALQQVLLRAAAGLPLTIGMGCTGVDSSQQQVKLLFDTGEDRVFDLVVGADGIRSAVRSAVAPGDSPAAYSGSTAWRAVVDAPGLVPTAWLTIGRGMQFLASPLPNGHVYWSPVLTMPAVATDRITDDLDFLAQRFGAWHEPIPALVGAAPNRTPVSPLQSSVGHLRGGCTGVELY